MSDTISRAAAIDAAVEAADEWDGGYSRSREEIITLKLQMLPSADRPKDKWIPIKWHYITDEERDESGYPKDWVYYLDCEMPEDGQEILVTTKHGYVEKDVCYLDDGYSLDSGWDWIEDIVAWMEMPPVYHEDDNK